MSLAAEILPDLKSFQRRTVEHAFDRLYDAKTSSRRFLVADEVGLGKTMVARGVVAKAVDRLREEGVKRIDVVYICSNQVIARQNISKLMVSGEEHDPVLDRITMLPAHLRDLDKHEVNLIPLTPQTSLDLRSQQGAARERVVLWKLLVGEFGQGFMSKQRTKRVLKGGCADTGFLRWGERWNPNEGEWEHDDLDPGLSQAFLDGLRADHQAKGDDSMYSRFEALAADPRRGNFPYWEAAKVIGDMRRMLARSCIDALEADLIILDEFQRFRNLITPDDPTGELAQMLFRQRDARILMLSATPYRMLTRNAEAEEDHHTDFLNTVDFLADDDGKTKARCSISLGEMRKGLKNLPESRGETLDAKRSLERRLRKLIARTERVTDDGNRNAMVEVRDCNDLELKASDVRSFAALDEVARAVGHHDTVEYWKSVPYPLNFMDTYVLAKDYVAEAMREPDARLKRGALDIDAIEQFKKVDFGNPRLRSLAHDIVGRGLWKLLWLPPSLPYYRPGKPYADFVGTNPTKRLVFSAWNVVPKAVSLLLSYDAERQLVRLGEHRANTPEDRKALQGKLRIDRSSDTGKAATMPTFALMLPSLALAEEIDPLRFRADGELKAIGEIRQLVETQLRPAVAELTKGARRSGRVNTAWYAAIPLLLEAKRFGRDAVLEWLRSGEVREIVGGRDAGVGSAWQLHLETAEAILANPHEILGKPPSNLLKVTALLALGGPGISAARALRRVAPEGDPDILRTRAVAVGDAMRGMFNWPEVVPLIRATDRTKHYWQDALQYCVNGNLQATLDEYAHVLSEWAPIPGEKTDNDRATGVGEAMLEALALHAADYEIRQIGKDGVPANDPFRMRPRFAIRFGDPKASEDSQVERATNVRASFNSPFWPFVLTSTSVGQEGLDFHLYCHAIMHWNLPSNPVDFEQREGRVHRYKGHAVRLNAASAHADAATANGAPDPWAAIFAAAPAGHDDLQPYWLLDGDAKILRFVPTLPWSQDAEREEQLSRLLASYRLAFGQPRQDDLLAHLGNLDLDKEAIRDLTVDLRPRRGRRP